MMKKSGKTKRNTPLSAVGKIFVGLFGIGGLISAFLCALSPFVNPSTFVYTAFFGLGFWMILFVNILVLIVLIILKSRKTLMIPIIALLISIPGFIKSFSFGNETNTDADIKIMTYNVSVFRDFKHKSQSVFDVKKKVVGIIKENSPDIVCFQESGSWPNNTAHEFASTLGFEFYKVNKTNGNSIFSKYPIEDVDNLDNDLLDKYIDINKVNINGRTLYVVNCHLNSFKITKEEIEYINDTKNIVKDSEIYGKSLVAKLKNGYEIRTKTSDLLLRHLPDDKEPIVICGDFNDTPLSYTYSRMRFNGFKDAFITSSFGIGKTYCGSLPLLRIDYFWYNNNVTPVFYNTIRCSTSDHYPLLLGLKIGEGEDGI